MAKKATNNEFHNYLKKLWLIYLGAIGLVLILFTCISLGVFGFMPTFEELENPRSNLASEIYSSDQVLLGKYYIENRSNVHFEDLSPNVVNALVATEDARFTDHSGIDARSLFRVMLGVFTRDRGAGGGSTITQQLAKNLFPRETNQNFLKVVITKFKEWITAVKLERNYTKQEIIAMYLNTVDFGNQSFGIKSAARTYFNKTPDSLNIQESATLIGLLKAPTRYSPLRNPENAMKRREVVLKQMVINGFISQVQYDSIRVLPIDMSHFNIQDHNAGLATYFREYLKTLLTKKKPVEENYVNKKIYQEDLDQWENNPIYGWCNKNLKSDGTPYNIFKDGLRIYTTINSKMQRYAEEAVCEHLGKELQKDFYKHWKGVKRAPYDWRVTDEQINKMIMQGVYRSERYQSLKNENVPDEMIMKILNTPVRMRVFAWEGDKDTVMSPLDSVKYYKWFLLAGLMSMEPQTGYVRAYVGGINYKHFQFDHVCLAKRQVGSTFKPFVYTVAMQEGEFSPCTKVPNVPITFDLPNGQVWEPKNSGDYREGEMITLKEALANSVNWISAFLIKRYSPGPVVKVARKMGIKSEIPEVYAICLGTPDLSLYEMVGAINSFPNKGVYIEPVFVTRIEDKYGNTLASFVPKTQEAMSEETAYLMTSLMQGVVEGGTGARLRGKYQFSNQIAGKTGTTDNNSDGWFMGFVPNLTTGIWVGCEDRSIHFRSTSLGQGANMSLPIWALYMKKVYADKSLNIRPSDHFTKPSRELSVEIDCQKYNQQNHPINFDNKNF
ncbi:MAG TPA: transglycosylase domain-containing protein [Bacteroidales bacterium]|nr:transglycosylase domain-containing protein [Bacteroidales bacterium]